jgi:hypothetical protein
MSQNKINIFKTIYYSLAVMAHLFFINWVHSLFQIPFYKRICFLTNISLYLNTIYYTSMLLVSLKLISFHRKLEISYFKFIYVVSFVVVVQYWGIIFLRPELMYREGVVMLPLTLDIFLHGVNFAINLLETRMIDPKENYSFTYLFYVGLCFVYGFILKMIHYVFDWVVYPFVAASHVHYVIILTIAIGMALIGDLTYNGLNRHHHHHHDQKKEEIHTN